MFIWLASIRHPVRYDVRGDPVGNFQSHLKGGWDFLKQPVPILRIIERVGGEVSTDEIKSLSIFGDALLLESSLGELATSLVPFAVIDLAQPARIFPRTCTEM